VCCWSVERTAGTMMQRMSDMLTRWLEGAMRRAENEIEADGENAENQSDSSDHDGPSVSVPAAGGASSTAGAEHVELGFPDVASLRLPPSLSPANDATASEVVSDVLCSASREVHDNVSLSDPATTFQRVDAAPYATDRTSTGKSDNLGVSNDSESNVDSQLDCQRRSQDTEPDSQPSGCILLSKPETDKTESACTCTSVVVDGADASELFTAACNSVDTIVSTETESQFAVKQDNEAVNKDKSFTSAGECVSFYAV